MVYRLNQTTWLQDAGRGAEIFYIQNWAMLTMDHNRLAAVGRAQVVHNLSVDIDLTVRVCLELHHFARRPHLRDRRSEVRGFAGCLL